MQVRATRTPGDSRRPDREEAVRARRRPPSRRPARPRRAEGWRPAAPGETDPIPRLAYIVYVVIGVIVASQHTYYAYPGRRSQVLSAVVATALWPLILLGSNPHLSLGSL